MADIPKLTVTKLNARLEQCVSAAEAVRLGIATHAEKHQAAMHAAREKAARDRRLAEGQ